MIRPAAVAGRFYPGGAGELERTVASLLAPSSPTKAIAVMAPHAGYAYSGATAGRVFSAVDVPERVIVLGPNHTGAGPRVSVWPDGAWTLPFGDVPIDEELVDRLVASHPEFHRDTAAHRAEHGIEVEVPFLHARNPALRLTAVVVGRISRELALELGACLAQVIREAGEPVLVVASSDMSHFISASAAARLDAMAFERIEALDPAGLYNVVVSNRITMCGVMPATITLAAANALNATRAKVIDYTHSGMVTGDDDSVVAYAGAVIQ